MPCTAFVYKGAELLLHTDGGASPTDVACNLINILHMNHFHGFYTGSLCAFLQMQLMCNRNYEDDIFLRVRNRYQCFENLLRILFQLLCYIKTCNSLFSMCIAQHFIGQLLADKLGIPCYYKEMVAVAAKESGLAKEFISNINADENAVMKDLYLSTEIVQNAITAQDKAIRKIADSEIGRAHV